MTRRPFLVAAKDLRPTTQAVIHFARLAVLLWSLIVLAALTAARVTSFAALWLMVVGGQAFVTYLVWFGRWAARRPRLGRIAVAWMLGGGWQPPARRTEYIRPPMSPRRTGQVIDVGQATYERKERP